MLCTWDNAPWDKLICHLCMASIIWPFVLNMIDANIRITCHSSFPIPISSSLFLSLGPCSLFFSFHPFLLSCFLPLHQGPPLLCPSSPITYLSPLFTAADSSFRIASSPPPLLEHRGGLEHRELDLSQGCEDLGQCWLINRTWWCERLCNFPFSSRHIRKVKRQVRLILIYFFKPVYPKYYFNI